MPEGKSVGRQEPAYRGPVQRQTYAQARRHQIGLLVLGVLAEKGRPTSARQLTEAFRQRQQPVDYYKVKAAVQALHARGLVCRTRIGNANWYELPPTAEAPPIDPVPEKEVETPLLGLILEVAKDLTRPQLKMLIDSLSLSLSSGSDDEVHAE